MLNEILKVLPESIHQISPTAAIIIAISGGVLALIGARFSQHLVTLSLVVIGAWVGLNLPKWLGWEIDPMGPAFGAAILLGLSGFVLTAAWEAILLGTLLSAWGGTITWILLAPGKTWHWPDLESVVTTVEKTVKVYQSLPLAVNKAFPGAVVVAMAIGCLFTPLYPRTARALLHSLAGVTLFVIASAIYARQSKPQWLDSIPANPWRQAGIFAGIVVLCMGVQWLFLPRMPKKPAKKVDKEGDETSGKSKTKPVKE